VSDDAELLERWRDGDKEAGSRLFDRHIESIYRFFRTKMSGDLDDMVQNTFMRCAQRRDDIREAGSFRAYLFAIARNVLRDHYRAKGRAPQVDFGTASVIDLGGTPSQFVVDKQEQALLLQALRHITIDEQICIELFYWEQLTVRELAGVLGIPEGTAKTRMRGARLSLEAKLAELARSPETLQSTLDNLDKWQASVREYLGREG
jgi:RNA polymerase sigma factor (sigma-70 family)